MTTPQKLTIIENKVREVCKDLQELSFGCEAHIRKGNCLNKYIINCIHHDIDGTIRYKVSCLDDKLFNPEDFTEIIGNPIQLQHILQVIYKTGYPYIAFDYSALVPCIIFDESNLNTRFNLSLPLAQQSDEFINWLYELLK